MMCDREKAEAFKKKAGTLGSVLGLTNMRNLMEELGNVQEALSIVHVAGTNGKGSVCAMLERTLRLSGYRTGRYNSPAVFSEEEKYQVNGAPISREELDEIFIELQGVCEALVGRGLPHPTLFELETAAAFLWFYRKKCQLVILETGLGGRMDATNIIRKPLCSVITPISMDHMAVLGDTLRKIALEKAGIIKEGCPVVTAPQKPEVYEVLAKACWEKGAKLWRVDREKLENVHYESWERESEPEKMPREAGDTYAGGPYLSFDWGGFKEIRLSLLGAYQAENACCVIETLGLLGELGFPVTLETLFRGLRTTGWPGRFEVVSREPLVVLDGAHNEAAAGKLRETLEMGFTNRKIIYIIGVLEDKEHEKMLKLMLPLADKVYTVTPENPRALPGEELCREARRFHGAVSCPGSVKEALRLALKDAAHEQGMILAFGSLSYLGELKRELRESGL